MSQRFKVLRLESHEEALHRWQDLQTDPLARRDKVDLIETFNCLLGLTVERWCHLPGFRCIEGTDPRGQRVVVLWNTEELIDAKNPENVAKVMRGQIPDVCYHENIDPPRGIWKAGREPQFMAIREAFTQLMTAADV